MTRENQTVVRLFVAYYIEKLIIEGMFTDYVRDRSLTTEICGTTSSAISLAESWLLTSESAPVAVAFDCAAEPWDHRVPIENIFSRAGARKRWHVALAIPDMTTWLLLDSKFAEAADKAQVPANSELELAQFFADWAKQPGNQFDREEVSQHNPDFAALNRFIEEHIFAAQQTS